MDYDLDENLVDDVQNEENAKKQTNARNKLPRGYMIARLMKGVVYKDDDPSLFNNI